MINNKKILSVITARQGSIRVPGKNYRLLLERPLVQWSILSSLRCPYIDLTVISSNCEGVKKAYYDLITELEYIRKDCADNNYPYPIECDAEVLWVQRPEMYCTSQSKNEEAMIHAYNYCLEKFDFKPDILINLQPTSPYRSDNLLSKCIEEYEKGYDSLLTCSEDTPFIWQKIDGEWKYTVDKNDCCQRKMRQDFDQSELIYHDCGCVYMTDAQVMLDKKCRIGEKPCIYVVDEVYSMQVDDETHFNMMEAMYSTMGKKDIA